MDIFKGFYGMGAKWPSLMLNKLAKSRFQIVRNIKRSIFPLLMGVFVRKLFKRKGYMLRMQYTKFRAFVCYVWLPVHSHGEQTLQTLQYKAFHALFFFRQPILFLPGIFVNWLDNGPFFKSNKKREYNEWDYLKKFEIDILKSSITERRQECTIFTIS